MGGMVNKPSVRGLVYRLNLQSILVRAEGLINQFTSFQINYQWVSLSNVPTEHVRLTHSVIC